MEKIEEKSNNEILLEMYQMQQDYEALRQHMLHKLDEMEAIEERYAKANATVRKRLTGESNQV